MKQLNLDCAKVLIDAHTINEAIRGRELKDKLKSVGLSVIEVQEYYLLQEKAFVAFMLNMTYFKEE